MTELSAQAKEMAEAAAVYIDAALYPGHNVLPSFWPWDRKMYTPLSPKGSLARAVALLTAALDNMENGPTEAKAAILPDILEEE